jgi:hypothetical protein
MDLLERDASGDGRHDGEAHTRQRAQASALRVDGSKKEKDTAVASCLLRLASAALPNRGILYLEAVNWLWLFKMKGRAERVGIRHTSFS